MITILSGVEMNKKYPDTFHIPAEQFRKGLKAGDFAKLMFTCEDGGGERMWVIVKHRAVEDSGRVVYHGTLDNDPLIVGLS